MRNNFQVYAPDRKLLILHTASTHLIPIGGKKNMTCLLEILVQLFLNLNEFIPRSSRQLFCLSFQLNSIIRIINAFGHFDIKILIIGTHSPQNKKKIIIIMRLLSQDVSQKNSSKNLP